MGRQFLERASVFLAISECVELSEYPNADPYIDYKKLMTILKQLPIYEAEGVEDGT